MRIGQSLPTADLYDMDVLVAQRTCNPHASAQFQHMARKREDVRTVYEIDDDVFSIEPGSSAYDGWSYVDDKIAVEANAAAADAVTVSTSGLADVFQDLSDNVHLLPNTVPLELLSMDKGRHKGLRIGYGGSPTHAGDWAPYAYAIGKASTEQGAELCVTGPDEIGTANVVQEPWCANVPDWWRRVATFDIGLAPLVDSRFNRSKSFIKILEYAALGVPFIASPVGPYREHVIDGVNGFLASTPEEWSERLTQLIRSPWLRVKMGNQARDWARDWITEEWIGAWEKLYLHG